MVSRREFCRPKNLAKLGAGLFSSLRQESSSVWSAFSSEAKEEASAVPETTGPRLARINYQACIGASSFCSSCVERCPIPDAISMENGLPRINPSLCDGCGMCAEYCVAPHPVISLLQLRRPVPQVADGATVQS